MKNYFRTFTSQSGELTARTKYAEGLANTMCNVRREFPKVGLPKHELDERMIFHNYFSFSIEIETKSMKKMNTKYWKIFLSLRNWL